MRTQKEIDIDFQMAMNEAGRLKEIAEGMGNLAKRDMADNLQSISMNWKGENASVYLRKGQELSDRIGDTASDLNDVAVLIENTARRIYEAEMRALDIANKRSYE